MDTPKTCERYSFPRAYAATDQKSFRKTTAPRLWYKYPRVAASKLPPLNPRIAHHTSSIHRSVSTKRPAVRSAPAEIGLSDFRLCLIKKASMRLFPVTAAGFGLEGEWRTITDRVLVEAGKAQGSDIAIYVLVCIVLVTVAGCVSDAPSPLPPSPTTSSHTCSPGRNVIHYFLC